MATQAVPPRRLPPRSVRRSLSRILRQLADEGHEFDEAVLSRLSPYLTEHVNRFGKYTQNLNRESPAPDYALGLRPGPEPVLASASL